jgi:undecaprenyl-diphosphatase
MLDHATRILARLRLNEVGPLLSLSLLSVFLWLFVRIADEVSEGDTADLDRAILLALRNPADVTDPIGPSWFEEIARDVTALGGNAVLTLVTATAVIYLALIRKRHAALLVLASVVGGLVLSTLLKLGFERPRPDLVPHGARVYTASFPSGHAMLSAVVYLTLGALLARVQPGRRAKAFVVGMAILISLLVGASRVYLGVHWPSDVLAGWCVGAAWAALCWFVALQLQRRGAVEPPGPAPEGVAADENERPDALSPPEERRVH